MGCVQGDKKQECQNISAAVNMSVTWKMKMEKKKKKKKPQEKENVSQREKRRTRRDVRASLRPLLALFAPVSSIPEEQDAFWLIRRNSRLREICRFSAAPQRKKQQPEDTLWQQ